MASQRQAMDDARSATDRAASITSFLTSKGLPPTKAWIDQFMEPGRANIPLSSLQQTALFRLLATDLTIAVRKDSTTRFPDNIADANVVEQRLTGPIVVQVLNAEDIGSSAWSQVEGLEAQERGETIRGREVIRVIPEEPTDASMPPMVKSSGPFKLLVQDVVGTRVHAFCMRPIEKLNFDADIGMKIVLENVTTARGMLLLEPINVRVLGGRVEAWDRDWRSSRKERLQQQVSFMNET